MTPATIVEADLARPDHQRDVVAMTTAYAMDVRGNDGPLPPEVISRLIPGLRQHPTTTIFLAYIEGRAVGIATCFLGFSTFTARSLLNIHDFAVLPEHRGTGVGRALLQAAELHAREMGCARLTLEVQDGNVRAKQVYKVAGFAQAVYGGATGGALFYMKAL
jgi:GNAT superfamily N-acetyltransferase